MALGDVGGVRHDLVGDRACLHVVAVGSVAQPNRPIMAALTLFRSLQQFAEQ
jgi:hypothetical protein